MFSFWEKQSFTSYDHIIVGAGIVGMSVGIELRKKIPQERILILERGFMPTGASSRNAGFACMGSVTELLEDLKTMSESEVVNLFAARKRGLEILKDRLGVDKIAYQNNGSYELINDQNIDALQQIDYLNDLLYAVNQKNTFKLANHLINAFGFSKKHTKSLIHNLCEGELNTGEMLRALSDYCQQQNIEIKTGAEVTRIEEQSDGVTVLVPDTLRKEEWRLNARHVYICTNAFTHKILPNEEVIPGRGQVLITKPISNLPFKGIFHFDKGYYYFRAFQNRVLLGGGRNLDFEQETNYELELNEMIQNKLDHLLREVILPNTDFEIEQRWSGIMALGKSKNPIVKSFSGRVHGAFRMGGMGVAMGSEVAERLVTSIFH